MSEQLVQSIIQTFEGSFPHRVCSYLLLGSYQDGTANSLSDPDLVVVFRDSLQAEEGESSRAVINHLAASSSVRLDILVTSQQALPHLHSLLRLAIKEGSQLLGGTDIRASL